MKKGYLRGLSNLYGYFAILLVSLAMVFVWNSASELLVGFGVSNGFVQGLDYAFYAIYGGLAIAGFSSLISRQMSGLDFVRVVGLLSIVGRLLSLGDVSLPLASMIFYIAVIAIFALQVLIRLFVAKHDGTSSGIKGFNASLFGKYNFILFSLIGFALGAFAAYKLQDLYEHFPNIIEMCVLASAGIFLGTMVAGLGSDSKKANLMDAVAYVALIAIISVVAFSYAKLSALSTEIGVDAYEAVILGGTFVSMALIIRGVTFSKAEEKNSRIKLNRYYKDSFSKNGLVAPLIIASLLITFFYLGLYGFNPLNILFVELEIEPLQFEAYYFYIITGVLAVFLIAPLFVRKFTYAKIKFVDKIVSLNMIISLFFIALIGYLALEDFEIIKQLFETTEIMVATIAFIVLAVFSIIYQLVRFINYENGYLDLVFEPAEIEQPVAEEPEVKEEIDEVAAELDQLSEEEYEQLVQELEAEEAEEVYEEVVEEVYEEVIEDEQSVEEEIVYVDENGEVIEEPVEEVIVEEVVEEATEEVVEESLDEAEEAVEEEADAEDDEEDDEDLDAEETEEAAEEVVEEAEAKEKGIIMPVVQIVDEDGTPKKIKRKFNAKMMFAPYETKEYYNEIKNYLLMYRAKGRYSSRCETFRYKGLVAKVSLGGKSIKVCLALDPQSLVNSKYKFKDVSNKRQYADVPVMIKVRSARGLKYFKELVDIMMANRLVKPKRNYVPTNYLPSLIPNGEAILATLGLSTDYLHNTMNVRGIPTDMPDDLHEYLPVIAGDELTEEELEAPVFLDTLCNHFEDGEEVTIERLKELHIVTKGNILRIRARGTLDRKLIIYAEIFDEDALKMLLCTNCTAIKIVR